MDFPHAYLKKYDKSNMHQVYDKWPELAKEYYNKDYPKIDYKKIDHIIFTGMGGSGAIGDVLSAILSKTKIHLCVIKGFNLPKTADSNTLVVATSASGNTVETLTILEKAKEAGCKLISFSSGGKLQDYCMKNNIEFIKVPVLNSPRASFPIYLYSILNVLKDLIPIQNIDVLESISLLEKTKKQISSTNTKNNSALNLAKWIDGIPMIYYPAGLYAAAIRFKNSLQENTKMHAIAEDVIEACHNGIVSWETSSNVQPILLQGQDDYIKTKQLWKVIKKYFILNKIEFREIHSVRGNILSKIINMIYLFDYATIYSAVMNERDPTPIKSIEYIKNKMKS